jgi:hypothetical protein
MKYAVYVVICGYMDILFAKRIMPYIHLPCILLLYFTAENYRRQGMGGGKKTLTHAHTQVGVGGKSLTILASAACFVLLCVVSSLLETKTTLNPTVKITSCMYSKQYISLSLLLQIHHLCLAMEFTQGQGQELVYRITGPQSIERLNPLIQLLGADATTIATTITTDTATTTTTTAITTTTAATAHTPVLWRWAGEADQRLCLVWETACERAWRDRHLQARVLNRLNNSQVGTMQCNAIQCNAIQCNAMQCNTMQCNSMQFNAL